MKFAARWAWPVSLLARSSSRSNATRTLPSMEGLLGRWLHSASAWLAGRWCVLVDAIDLVAFPQQLGVSCLASRRSKALSTQCRSSARRSSMSSMIVMVLTPN